MSFIKNEFRGSPGIFYYKDKQCTILHREDGLAIEYKTGTKHWFVNGKKHREDGPATEWSDGGEEYLINGAYHRLDGPAIIYTDGFNEYWVYGARYSEEDYWNTVKFIGFM